MGYWPITECWRQPKSARKAASNAAWAVLLDEESAEAHTSLAHVKSTQDWDWAGAEREFQRAINLNPRYASAHHWYAMSCLVPLARLDEAMEELLRAQALDPVSSIISREIAVTHYYKRDFDLALEQCDHTIEQNPHFSAAYWTLGLVQDERKEFDEAIAAFQRAIQLIAAESENSRIARPDFCKGRKAPAGAPHSGRAWRTREEEIRLALRAGDNLFCVEPTGQRISMAHQGVPGPLL